jgi:hypothetical protein
MYLNYYLTECVAKEHHAELLRKAAQRTAYRFDAQQPPNAIVDWLTQRWKRWHQRPKQTRPWVFPSELAKIKQIG